MTPPFGSDVATIVHLRKVKKQTGKTPLQLQEFESKQAPQFLRYILDLFKDFYNGQTFSYMELESWQNVIGVEIDYVEAELIRQLCLEREAFDFKRHQEHQRQLTAKGRK